MVCLTFDIEEFDTPMVDYNVVLPLRKQMAISKDGLMPLLDMLQGMGVRATFFTTGVFAENAPEVVKRIVEDGHELASHSYCHTKFTEGDYLKSKEVLEQISGVQIKGYRSPRMGGADAKGLSEAGYSYDSSLHPCWLPGKYNNFKAERSLYDAGCGVTEVPASVATGFRIPLFWLALHNFPLKIYEWLAVKALKRDGHLNIYFHPWEFSEYIHSKELKIPFYIRRNAGTALILRLANVIDVLKERGYSFGTMSELVEREKRSGKC